MLGFIFAIFFDLSFLSLTPLKYIGRFSTNISQGPSTVPRILQFYIKVGYDKVLCIREQAISCIPFVVHFSFSPIFKSSIFHHIFLINCATSKVVLNRTRLLLLISSFNSSYFLFSSFQKLKCYRQEYVSFPHCLLYFVI